QDGFQTPTSSSSARQGPSPVRTKSVSSADSARCTLQGPSWWRSMASRIAWKTDGATEYGACAARLPRTDACSAGLKSCATGIESCGTGNERNTSTARSTTAAASGGLNPINSKNTSAASGLETSG